MWSSSSLLFSNQWSKSALCALESDFCTSLRKAEEDGFVAEEEEDDDDEDDVIRVVSIPFSLFFVRG